MARDFKNKIMAAKYVFSKISRGNVGKGQERICNCICCKLMSEDIDLFGKSGDTCNLKTMLDVFCG